MTLNCNGTLLDLTSPKVMGILNITPDSFFDGGKNSTVDLALKACEKMVLEGADLIDIGAQSTRPGAEFLSEEIEIQRLEPVIKELTKSFPKVIFSVDTFYGAVAQKAVEWGASMVNDVSGGGLDPKMFDVISDLSVPYVLMHMGATPATMGQNIPTYKDVCIEVNYFLMEKANVLLQKGISDIVLDPGFGFGKTLEDNYALLNHLSFLGLGNFPILVGVSRKSMAYKPLGISPNKALNATTALNVMALERGANILRVHDVLEAKQACEVFALLKNNR
ncbi:MAG: dihydropteroate synthase [Flavobacteriaceae bacterium]|nr:MAG: dihydropteroate synthase [Flavobacteriaceae bacterium]